MPYNPGNIRKLNALGGKRPQATGIVLLPKNGDRVLSTSEGSVNNYGGNKKMGLYSNVGMSYQFQNLKLTGARINGNMPYFWATKGAVTKPARETKNMLTVKMLDDGDTSPNVGTKGFVSDPYWLPISRDLLGSSNLGLIDDAYINSAMGSVNGKKRIVVGDVGIIAIEMWRIGSSGPVNALTHPGIHIWTDKPLNFSSIVIRQGGVECQLNPTAVYSKASPPINSATVLPTGANPTAAELAEAGNANDAVSNALGQTNVTFPDNGTNAGGVVGLATAQAVPDSDAVRVYWCRFQDATGANATQNGINARRIFSSSSAVDAQPQGATVKRNISTDLAIYFK